MTESEELFRRFCKSQGWRVERIDEHAVAEGSEVPESRLQSGDGTGIVVEVKQFDPNPEEQQAAQGSGSGMLGGKPGHQLRQVIPKSRGPTIGHGTWTEFATPTRPYGSLIYGSDRLAGRPAPVTVASHG